VRPFDVKEDAEWSGMDAALAILPGNALSMTQSSSNLLSTLATIGLPRDEDSPVTFPAPDLPAIYTCLETVMSSVGLAHSSPAPRLHQRLALNFHPKYRHARQEKDHLIQSRLHKSWKRLHESAGKEDSPDCAADVFVQRELVTARKKGREPQYDNPAIQDELFGLMFAGHDTTTASILWGLKFLVANQEV
jgi:cytochrome P450